MSNEKIPYDYYWKEKECIIKQLESNEMTDQTLAEIYDWYYPEKSCKNFFEKEPCKQGLNNGCMMCVVNRIREDKKWADSMIALLKNDIVMDFFDDYEMFVLYNIVFASENDPLDLRQAY